jgi:hypothetical protein
MPRVREFPFDIAIFALGAFPWLLSGLLTLRVASTIRREDIGSGVLWIIVGMSVLALATLRIVWLFLRLRQRRGIVGPASR